MMKLSILLVLGLTTAFVRVDSCVPDESCEEKCYLGYEVDDDGFCLCQCKTSGVYGGDILIEGEEDYKNLENTFKTGTEESSRTRRAAQVRTKGQWPKSGKYVNILYKFETEAGRTLTNALKTLVRQAAQQFQKHTCIRLLETRAPLNFWTDSYIMFGDYSYRSGNTCLSRIGQTGMQQNISLHDGNCNSRGVVMHEIMHALGFWHEHQRPDRDFYIRIYPNNIIQNKKYAFDKQVKNIHPTNYGSRYDFNSLMHYSSTLFSRNRLPTMLKLNGDTISGHGNDFSVEDIKQINRKYQCNIPTTTKRPITTTTPAPVAPRIPPCVDRNREYCTNLQRRNQCRTSMAEDNCQRTCGYCGVSRSVVKIPKLTINTGCVDNYPRNCPGWVRNDGCRFFGSGCRRSCGLCQA